MAVAGGGAHCVVRLPRRRHLQSLHLLPFLVGTYRASGYLPGTPPPEVVRCGARVAVRDGALVALIGSFREREPIVEENRLPATLPGASSTLRDWLAFPGRFERYFNDHFGSRTRLLALDHWAKAVIFGVSPVPTVLVGKAGLAVLPGRGRQGLRSLVPRHRRIHRRGDRGAAQRVPPSPRISGAPRHSLCGRRRAGKIFGVFRVSAGLGATCHAEHGTGPHRRRPGAPPRASFRRSAHRAARGEREQTRLLQNRLPLNFVGASVGYRVLMAELERLLPGLSTVPPRQRPYDPAVDFYSGDLSRMIGATARFREDDIAPLWKILADTSPHCARRDSSGETPGFEFYVYGCPVLRATAPWCIATQWQFR